MEQEKGRRDGPSARLNRRNPSLARTWAPLLKIEQVPGRATVRGKQSCGGGADDGDCSRCYGAGRCREADANIVAMRLKAAAGCSGCDAEE
eukprot:scaffold10177_cov96-Isochrysis_galbana.AAC.2